jgi:hypothetical protein
MPVHRLLLIQRHFGNNAGGIFLYLQAQSSFQRARLDYLLLWRLRKRVSSGI